MLIMKYRLLLLDANVVIYLCELGLWGKFINQCDVTLTNTVVEEVKSYNLRSDIQSGKIRCVEASLKSIQVFRAKLGAAYLDRMDPGEAESLAYLMESREQWLLSSGDEIVYKTLGLLNRAEQGISLEEILQGIGLGRAGLEIQYTKEFRRNVTRKGQRDSVTGLY
jgi:hypothetical protein